MMRKILEIVALLVTIVGGLIAIIVFISGRASLPALVTGSSPTTTLTVTSASSTNKSIAVGTNPVTASGLSSMGGAYLPTLVLLLVASLVIILSKKADDKYRKNSKRYLLSLGMMLVLLTVTSLVYELLGTVVTVPIILVLYANAIIYPACLLIAYSIRKWVIY